MQARSLLLGQSPIPLAPLLHFTFLQLLDGLSTIAFLLNGVEEANPLLRGLMMSGHPLLGLLLIKAVAVGLAVLCLWLGREKVLMRMNVFFACLVVWNLLALIVKSGS
jgi:hypothetical protein